MTRRERGLGLLELLVALVLVTLASTLVMQGIGQGLGMLRRVAADQGVAYHELMARAWLRETVAAAATEAGVATVEDTEEDSPELPDARAPALSGPVFRGSAGSIEMRSFRPLLGAEGVATDIRWSADAQQGLRYEEGEQQVLVDALPPVQRIEYQGPDGDWQPQWPPAQAAIGDGAEASELPVRVRFLFSGDDRLDVLLLARHGANPEEDLEAGSGDIQNE